MSSSLLVSDHYRYDTTRAAQPGGPRVTVRGLGPGPRPVPRRKLAHAGDRSLALAQGAELLTPRRVDLCAQPARRDGLEQPTLPLDLVIGHPHPGGQAGPGKPEHHLGGVLTHGSILVSTSTGAAPHPVYRAVWLREAILGDRIKEGDVVIIRYEGPKGGPGMQEMLYPTSYLKSKGLGKACALVTDGRFSGGTSGLSIGHCSPEAAEGGNIGLVEEGDIIEIDIPNRSIRVVLEDDVLAGRRAAMEAKGEHAWKPQQRDRFVSQALQAYAAMTTSAARGAVRDISQLRK